MSKQITIEVSELVVQRAMRAAARTDSSVEEVLASWLEAYHVAYILQELLAAKSDDVAGRSKMFDWASEIILGRAQAIVNELPVEELSNKEVLALTELRLTDEQQAALDDLLARNREGTLDAEGRKQLDELMRIYEQGLLRKSQALRVAVQRELIEPLQQ